MRPLLVLLLCIPLSALAQDRSATEPVCRVTILSNKVDLPDDRRDGLTLMRVFVSTSTSCVAGEVDIAAYPTGVCTKEPSTDLNNAAPMTFAYKPAVLKVSVTPGNINSGVIEISSGVAGQCTFNSHVAACGSVVPPGGRCVTRDLTDPQPEAQGDIDQVFNRLR